MLDVDGSVLGAYSIAGPQKNIQLVSFTDILFERESQKSRTLKRTGKSRDSSQQSLKFPFSSCSSQVWKKSWLISAQLQFLAQLSTSSPVSKELRNSVNSGSKKVLETGWQSIEKFLL